MSESPEAAALLMRGIRKRFPGVVALDGVDFELRRGEVHVLLGENGAGKSTLVKILGGAYPRDAGEILLDGVPTDIRSPRDARALGISIIYQELNLVPQLSAAENIFLGKEPRRAGLVDRDRLRREAAELLESLDVRIEPSTPVRALGLAQQQMVEVAKALSDRARILVMDEPTSALATGEVRQLFRVIGQLTASGVAIVYISHRLEEVVEVGRRVTVLRDGRHIATRDLRDVTVGDMVRLMANREISDRRPRRIPSRGGRPADELLRVEHLSRAGTLEDVSFVLRRGELVGIAGLLGAGRTELARAIAGADPPDAGRVRIKGAVVRPRTPADMIRHGLGFLPEDRKTQGLVTQLSVQRNLALPNVRRLTRFGLVDRAAEAELGRRAIGELRIKTPGLAERVVNLSGGNQQKVVLGKWLAAEAEILIFDEPTRGIDVGAKSEIYELMNRLTDAGAGILMISSELPEVLGMSDRILVMHRGRIAAELAASEATEERVLQAALGLAS